jgi:hypothetical protein
MEFLLYATAQGTNQMLTVHLLFQQRNSFIDVVRLSDCTRREGRADAD